MKHQLKKGLFGSNLSCPEIFFKKVTFNSFNGCHHVRISEKPNE